MIDSVVAHIPEHCPSATWADCRVCAHILVPVRFPELCTAPSAGPVTYEYNPVERTNCCHLYLAVSH
jgi:hypothetical protein